MFKKSSILDAGVIFRYGGKSQYVNSRMREKASNILDIAVSFGSLFGSLLVLLFILAGMIPLLIMLYPS